LIEELLEEDVHRQHVLFMRLSIEVFDRHELPVGVRSRIHRAVVLRKEVVATHNGEHERVVKHSFKHRVDIFDCLKVCCVVQLSRLERHNVTGHDDQGRRLKLLIHDLLPKLGQQRFCPTQGHVTATMSVRVCNVFLLDCPAYLTVRVLDVAAPPGSAVCTASGYIIKVNVQIAQVQNRVSNQRSLFASDILFVNFVEIVVVDDTASVLKEACLVLDVFLKRVTLIRRSTSAHYLGTGEISAQRTFENVGHDQVVVRFNKPGARSRVVPDEAEHVQAGFPSLNNILTLDVLVSEAVDCLTNVACYESLDP